MSCVREASSEPPYQPQIEQRNGESRKGRFLRGLRRMFRRRTSSRSERSPDTSKSRSTSELLATEHRRKESAYGSGLSVSHDSIFTGERSGDDSAEDSSNRHTRTTPHRAEVVAAVRRRARAADDGSDDEEDLGLPRSPPASPPTDKLDKHQNTGISASSCSDGSLLSVDSSEMDEESSSGNATVSRSELNHTDAYTWYEPPSGVAPLSHSAAKHKMAVRPKRTHGAPRRKRNNQLPAAVLPITPELNEDNTHNFTPDVPRNKNIGEIVTYDQSNKSSESIKIHGNEREESDLSEIKAKSSSLPPGLALSQMVHSSTKLSVAKREETPRSSIKRSKSSSQSKPLKEEIIHSSVDPNPLEDYNKRESYDKKIDPENKVPLKENFFSRLLLRKSGKKKKEANDSDSRTQTLERSNNHYKNVDKDYLDEVYMQTTHHITVECQPNAAGQPTTINQKKYDSKHMFINESQINKGTFINHGQNNFQTQILRDKVDKFNMKYHSKEKDPFADEKKYDQVTKTYIPKGIAQTKENYRNSKGCINEDLITPEIKPRRNPSQEYTFHSGSMPKSIPYFNKNLQISCSASPPKSTFNEYTPHFSSGYNLDRGIPQVSLKPEATENYAFKFYKNGEGVKQSSDSNLSEGGQKSNLDIEKKNSVGKSQSFRYPTENFLVNWQNENQLPSLPAIAGISNAHLGNWNTEKNQNEQLLGYGDETDKRLSARNYNVFNASNDNNFDSLQSTDSSYLDSLKTEMRSSNDISSIFSNEIENNKLVNDISQIEAKIDNIIGSKPLPSCILKSNSLDSVKSIDKTVDDRRKTISVEEAFAPCIVKPLGKESFTKSENYITVTHLNDDKEVGKVTVKVSKSDERLQKNPNVPEFLQIQLNKVDTKPLTHVVLNANPVLKRCDHKEKVKINSDVRVTNDKMSPTKINSSVNSINKSHESLNGFQINGDSEKVKELNKSLIKKSPSGESVDAFVDKSRSKSLSETTIDHQTDKMERKSLLNFGSKTSLQSGDSNDSKSPDRQDEPVVFRRKPGGAKGSKDDEPELLKVFARRSLKIKDSDELFEANNFNEEACNEIISIPANNNVNKIKTLNTIAKDEEEENLVSVQDRVAELTANAKFDAKKYKKEVADSTPEKRFRNRTFPDPISPPDSERKLPIRNFSFASSEIKDSNKPERKNEPVKLSKVEKTRLNESNALKTELCKFSKVEHSKMSEGKANKVEINKECDAKGKNEPSLMKTEASLDNGVSKAEGVKSEVCEERRSPEREVEDEEFRGILHVREQWERRAQQAKAK